MIATLDNKLKALKGSYNIKYIFTCLNIFNDKFLLMTALKI